MSVPSRINLCIIAIKGRRSQPFNCSVGPSVKGQTAYTISVRNLNGFQLFSLYRHVQMPSITIINVIIGTTGYLLQNTLSPINVINFKRRILFIPNDGRNRRRHFCFQTTILRHVEKIRFRTYCVERGHALHIDNTNGIPTCSILRHTSRGIFNLQINIHRLSILGNHSNGILFHRVAISMADHGRASRNTLNRNIIPVSISREPHIVATTYDFPFMRLASISIS